MSTMTKPEMQRGAEISADGQYRYWLHRKWGESARLNVIMLNPSIADALIDDPTIRRVIGFAARERFQDVMITNIFALRATDPKALYKHDDPIGPENNETLMEQARQADRVWIAWGAHGNLLGRADDVLRRLSVLSQPLYCFGTTKGSQPRHPLYQANNAPLTRWSTL